MDWLLRKFAFVYLKCTEFVVSSIVLIYSLIYSGKRKASKVKSIGAYWYYPPDTIGSDIRMGAWKPFFETNGISYENLYINKHIEVVEKDERGTWTSRYLFFARCLWRRLPQLLKSHRFDVIWVQRNIIPFYPRNTAFLERCIKRTVNKMVVDTTDGSDYKAAPALMEEVLAAADEVTVGYKHLKEAYEDRVKVTQVFWTIPSEKYKRKTEYKLSSPPVIGWMGSPSNFRFVSDIVQQLRELAGKYDFVLSYICRENQDDKLAGINVKHHYYGNDYYEILKSFDIGIAPVTSEEFSTMGKIAMKHLEFMLSGIPQVCSNISISEFVKDNEHVIIAPDKEAWVNKLSELLENEPLRRKLGESSVRLFNSHYTYECQFEKLFRVLTE